MKKILIIPATVLFTYCSTFKSHKASSTSKRDRSAGQLAVSNNSNATNDTPSDTIDVIGSQYIPMEGRSETGTRPTLEGAWELDSLNGAAVPGKSALNVQPVIGIPAGTEVRRDSTTRTRTVNGVTRTTTTVLIDKSGTPGNKITPPQGTNYHIPAKPSISFFGANETFSGFTGCNKFSGRYKVSGRDTITLEGVAASTKMVCLGDYDEEAFLNTLRKVTIFRGANGRLELISGNKVLLAFSRKQQ